MNSLRRVLIVLPLLISSGSVGAQNKPAASTPDISGMWELGYDSRSVPLASLTTQATASDQNEIMRHDLNAIRWCQMVGLPLLMDTGAPLDIVQDKKQVAISADRAPAQLRQIYLNTEHPNMDIFDPQTVGHSVGKWDGDILVVDTIGFSDKGVISIPGGGWRTETSHLVERYRLFDNGRKLSVTFTWQDPAVYQEPHTYEFNYTRAPQGTSARTYRCDASDQTRAEFILRPLKSH